MNINFIRNKIQFYKCFTDEKSKKLLKLYKRAEILLTKEA